MLEKSIQISDSDLALCRSGLYEAFALGFGKPCHETIERLLATQHNDALAELAEIIEKENKKSPAALRVYVRELTKCQERFDLALLEKSFRSFFGHTAHSSVPPYETEYGSDTLFQQPQQLADITGFFTAFGLKLNQYERADHIVCECEFMSFLTRKEAYALEPYQETVLKETRKAQKLFLKDHLACFTPSFSNMLIRKSPGSFYSKLGKLLLEFVRIECVQFNIPAGPENLRLRPKVTADDCLTCGSGGELIREITDPNQLV